VHGKRVSCVELYLDLVFVLAIGRLAHVIVDEPELRSVWIALGGFVVLWWTWIGFAVLHNRHGEDDRGQHLRFLAGSIPIGVAAVALVATFMLGRLHGVLSPHAFLYVATAWVVGCAALSSRRAAATRPYRGTR
jgi:low temperature requirement protein LtrA